MRNRHLIAVTLLVGVTAALLSPTCTNPAGGTATETGNVSGVIYNAGGTPAAGATVRFYPVDYNPQNGSLGKVKVTAAVASKDSVTTDAYGRYSVTLDSGSYNLLASGDTTLAFHDSLPARRGDTAHHTDTLRAPGSIQGVIKMQGSDDPRTVFIIFIGTGNVDVPQDSLGNFLIRNLAQGSYHVRFLSTLDLYTVKDTSLSVTAGRVDTLAATRQLTYTGIPVPAGLKIQYDTNMQVVTLVWNKPTTGSPVQGYEIYRKNAAYNTLPTAINSLIVTDTVYHDSTGVLDSGYTYYVATVDTGNGGVGRMSGGVGVTIQSAFAITDTLFNFGANSWIYAAERDAAGNYVVVNGTAYYPTPAKIARYSSAGTEINSWNIPGGIEDMFAFNCLSIGDSNTLFIITKNNIVIRYDTAGNILSQFQYPGTARGFAALGDTIYIGDRIVPATHAYSSDGDSLFSWGSYGTGINQFSDIVAIMADSSSKSILVEDAYDYARIQTFDRNGNYQQSVSFKTIGSSGGNLSMRNDTILVCGATIFACTKEGNLIYQYKDLFASNVAWFENMTDNNILVTWTGQVLRNSKR
jgi:hypothetical protein